MGSLRKVIHCSVALAVVCAAAAGGQTPGSASPTNPSRLSPAPTTTPTALPEFEFRGGRWIPLTDLAPTSLPANETLDRAEDFLQRGGWRAARRLVLRWFETHDKRHPLRDRATFILAECYFQSGNRVLSFYHFDEVMDLYPESRLFRAALQRQYDIADAFLRGYKARFLRLPILSMQDEAIEILFRIQSRAPGSPLAERALLRTADFYYATSQFDLAADAYGSYATSFPRSPLVGRVRLRQAFSQMGLFRGTRFDATPIVDARELLSDLIVSQPELARQESLPSVVGRIDEAQARKLLQTADWYGKTNQFRGAVYIYRLLIEQYAESADATTARDRLANIPERFLSDPAPGTTQPPERGDRGLALPSTGPTTNGSGQ